VASSARPSFDGLSVNASSSIVVRVAYSRWLGLVDASGKPLPAEAACLSGLASDRQVENPRDNWLVLHASEAGTYRIGAPYKVPRGSACP